MNEEMNAQGLLDAAARLVERALLKLDTQSKPCHCCARDTWANRLHARLYEDLHATPEKLRRAAGRLEAEARGDEDTRPTNGFVESVRHEELNTGGRR